MAFYRFILIMFAVCANAVSRGSAGTGAGTGGKAPAKSQTKNRGSDSSDKAGWNSKYCEAEVNEDEESVSITRKSSARRLRDIPATLKATIAGNPGKCGKFEAISVYSCVPQVPEWKQVIGWTKWAIEEASSFAGTFGATNRVAAGFATDNVMQAVSYFLPQLAEESSDVEVQNLNFQDAVNAEFDKVYDCLDSSTLGVLATVALTKIRQSAWEFSDRTLTWTEGLVDTKVQKVSDDIHFLFENWNSSIVAEAVALLPVLDFAIPNYITVFTGYMAALEVRCNGDPDDRDRAETCEHRKRWLQLDNKYIDEALDWLKEAKKNMLARYVSWTPKACTKWIDAETKYEKLEFVLDPSKTMYGAYSYASQRKCESYEFKAIPTKLRKRSGWFGVQVQQHYWKDNVVGEGYVKFGDYKKRVDVTYSMIGRTMTYSQSFWNGAEPFKVSDSGFGLEFAKNIVADEIAAYKEDLEEWSAIFDEKYIAPLQTFKNNINGIECYPQNECPDGYMDWFHGYGDSVKKGWACGADCPGGTHDYLCRCTCIAKPPLCPVSALSNPFEHIAGDDFVDGGRLTENYFPYWMYAIAFVPFILCCIVNAVCAYKHCRNEKSVYEKVDLIVEDEDVNEV